MIMMPIVDREWEGRRRTTPAKGSIDWIRQLHEGLPENLKPFGRWPIAVANAVEDELKGVEGAVPRVSILMNAK